MLGGNPGWVISQHEILLERFARENFVVMSTSSRTGRVTRVLDTLWTASRWRGKADCVLIAVFSGPGFAVADLTSTLVAAAGIPQIQVLHGGNLPEFTHQHPRWAHRVMSRADVVVAPSRYLASEVDAASEIEVVPNIFDLGEIPFGSPDPGSARVLWMRTFHEIYDPLSALDAFAEVARALPEARLTMAGQDKGLEGECRERARRLGVAEIVRFPGFLDPEAKLQALREHDVFLNTNLVDNTPVSVLEAMAAGLPVVAASVGGIPYLIDHDATGLLCPPGDAGAMAAAIVRLATDPALAAQLSLGGRQVAERSDWDSVRAQWLTQIDRAIARHRR
jgi:glycosyltransferase involved in cell wall biosynthesis